MNFGVALLLIGQAAASSATAPSPSTSPPIATVKASARIIQPTTVWFDRKTAQIIVSADNQQQPQRTRDATGTVWIEFS